MMILWFLLCMTRNFPLLTDLWATEKQDKQWCCSASILLSLKWEIQRTFLWASGLILSIHSRSRYKLFPTTVIRRFIIKFSQWTRTFSDFCIGVLDYWTCHLNSTPGRWWSLLLWSYSRFTWMPIYATYFREPSLSGGWARWSLEIPSNLCGSVTLWFSSFYTYFYTKLTVFCPT